MIFVVRILSENAVYKNRKDIRSHFNLSIDRDISNFEFKKFEYTKHFVLFSSLHKYLQF